MINATPLIDTTGMTLLIRAYILANDIVLINSYIDTGTGSISVNEYGVPIAKFDFKGKLIMGVITPMTEQFGDYLYNIRITQEGIVNIESRHTTIPTARRGGFTAITYQY